MKEIRLEPGTKIGVTADTHVGHANILQYCLRPWLTEAERQRVRTGEKIKVEPASVLAHDDALVERTNALLGPDDVLVHAGDVAWGSAALASYRERLHVRRVYVAVGNHDDEDELVRLFGRDFVFERFCLAVGHQKAVIDHYPGDSWQQSHRGAYLLFGHVHGAANTRRRQNPHWALSLDVGVDSHDFRPWLWSEELVPRLDARKEKWRLANQHAIDKEQGGMAPDGAP